ncbi:MAG: metalloregulator ArsR/SmtB family transcription factor [bacterium]
MPAQVSDNPTSSVAAAVDVVRLSKALGDLLRTQILAVLAQNSFAVLELCSIFDKPQPALSHHLKKLADAGLVNRRQEGTSIFYQRAHPEDPLTEAAFTCIDSQTLNAELLNNVQQIYQQRVQRSAHFFAHQADALAQQTALICAPEVYIDTVLDCVHNHSQLPLQNALEIGPGNGALMLALAPLCRHITGIDNAAEMLNEASRTLAQVDNVTLQEQDFSSLPGTRQFDFIAAAMVLHHLPAPAEFFRQARTLMTDNALLVVAELCRHEQTWVSDLCADIWLGFDTEDLDRWATQAGMTAVHQQYLAQRNGFRVQVSAFAPAC